MAKNISKGLQDTLASAAEAVEEEIKNNPELIENTAHVKRLLDLRDELQRCAGYTPWSDTAAARFPNGVQ